MIQFKNGDYVYLVDGKKWKIIGFYPSNKQFTLKVIRSDESRYISIHRVRTQNNECLLPRNAYELSLGSSSNKYAIVLEQISIHNSKSIIIKGKNQNRRIQKISISKINMEIYCGTEKAFDEKPEIIEINIDDEIHIVKGDGDYEVIEKAGKKGVVTSINTKGVTATIRKNGNSPGKYSTLKVQFEGVSKHYSIHRFIDKFGNAMCYGWHYKINRKCGAFRATPDRKNKDGKLSWDE
jgi:hypothetical protein